MKKIKFGTDGWRAIIAEDFTFENVRMVSEAIARYLNEQGARKGIVVGYDHRFLSEKFAEAVAEVFAAHGIPVLLTDRATPTPVVAFAILHYGVDGAVMITASHNPPEYNGIKFIPYYASPAMPDITDNIEGQLVAVWKNDEKFKYLPFQEGLKKGRITYFDPMKAYLEHLSGMVDRRCIKQAGLKVVIDPMYGAGSGYLERFLEKICKVITLHSRRDPLFGGGLPDPTEKHLKDLGSRVVKEKANLGLALDGDADRFGIIDEKGRYFCPNEMLSMFLFHLLKNRQWRGGTVARTVATTHMLDRIAGDYKLGLHETPVGFKYIGLALRKKNSLLGGEESGGMSIRGHVPEKDGILAAVLTLEMLSVTGECLSEIQQKIFSKYGVLVSKRLDVGVDTGVKQEVLKRLHDVEIKKIAGVSVVEKLTVDGVKFILSDGGWILVRLSGTEPFFRIYGEASDTKRLDDMQKDIREIIGI